MWALNPSSSISYSSLFFCLHSICFSTSYIHSFFPLSCFISIHVFWFFVLVSGFSLLLNTSFPSPRLSPPLFMTFSFPLSLFPIFITYTLLFQNHFLLSYFSLPSALSCSFFRILSFLYPTNLPTLYSVLVPSSNLFSPLVHSASLFLIFVPLFPHIVVLPLHVSLVSMFSIFHHLSFSSFFWNTMVRLILSVSVLARRITFELLSKFPSWYFFLIGF